MKKLILVYGIISGSIMALMLIIMLFIFECNGGSTSGGYIIGYSSQLLAMSFIFIAVHTYKKKYLGGRISFLKAWKIGLLIALISSAFYVITWAFMYKFFYPDFMENYATEAIKNMEKAGKSAADIEDMKKQMELFKNMYKTIPGFAGLTFMEVFPTGFVMSLIAAIVFSIKKKKKEGEQNPVTQ